jgi:Tfp pilus assembly protein PilF
MVVGSCIENRDRHRRSWALVAVAAWLAAACAEVGAPRVESPVVKPARNLFDEGVELRESGEGDLALHKFEAAVALSPAFVDAHRALQNLSLARYQRGLMIERYTRFLAEDPSQAYRWYLRGRLASSPERQASYFEHALECDAGAVWPHVGMGFAFRAQGEEARAAAMYKKALEIEPESVAALQGLVELLTATGEYREAERVLDLYWQVAPNDREAARLTMQLKLAAGQSREAVEIALQLLNLPELRAEDLEVISEILLKAASDAQQQSAYALLAPRAGEGRPDIDHLFGQLAMRQGDLKGALRSLRRAYRVQPSSELERDLRYLLVATGRPVEALDLARANFPAAPQSRLEIRWKRARAAAEEAVAFPSAGRDLALARALAELGWTKEAQTVLSDVFDADYHSYEARELRREIEAERLFEERLADYFRRTYEDFGNQGKDKDLDAVLDDLRDLSVRTLRRNVVDPVVRKEFPPIGSFLDPEPDHGSGLARYFDRFNRFFLLGRRTGGPTEAVLLTRLADQELDRGHKPPARVTYVENLRIPSYLQYRGGAIAGAALGTFVFLDLDPIRRDANAAIALYRRFGEHPEQFLDPCPTPAETEGERVDLLEPLDLAARFRFRSYQEAVRRGESDSAYLSSAIQAVLCHEQTHLDDAARFLPLTKDLLSKVWIFVTSGFSLRKIEAWIEQRAQIMALATADDPFAVMAVTSSYLPPSENPITSHGRGYVTMVERIVNRIATQPERYPQLRQDRNLLQQLASLTADQLHEIGRALAREEGMEPDQ